MRPASSGGTCSPIPDPATAPSLQRAWLFFFSFVVSPGAGKFQAIVQAAQQVDHGAATLTAEIGDVGEDDQLGPGARDAHVQQGASGGARPLVIEQHARA